MQLAHGRKEERRGVLIIRFAHPFFGVNPVVCSRGTGVDTAGKNKGQKARIRRGMTGESTRSSYICRRTQAGHREPQGGPSGKMNMQPHTRYYFIKFTIAARYYVPFRRPFSLTRPHGRCAFAKTNTFRIIL